MTSAVENYDRNFFKLFEAKWNTKFSYICNNNFNKTAITDM